MILNNDNMDWLEGQANFKPKSPALRFNNLSLSFAELNRVSNNASHVLRNYGVKSKIRAAILANNSPEYVVCVTALWKIGAIPVPLNTRLIEEELENLILSADIDFLFFDIKMEETVDKLGVKHKFELSKLATSASNSEKYPIDFDPDNTAIILFTSGSEGMPKGVELTFNNFYSSFNSLNQKIDLTNGGKWLASLPFYHIGGFSIITRSLISGAELIISENFNADQLINYCTKFNPNYISLVPTMLSRFLQKNFKPSKNLRAVFVGGGPVNKEFLIKSVEAGWPVHLVYGSTETCSMITMLQPAEITARTEKAGKPLPGASVNIVDENGNELPVGEKGKIKIRAGSVMKCYINSDKPVEEKPGGNTFISEDIGSMDEDGYLTLYSRNTELIISGGENIIPSEVQKIINQIKGVESSFVFGAPDAEWGQVVCAAVVTHNGAPIDTEFFHSSLRKFLSPIKIPKRIFFVEELPVTEMGKIKKDDLLKLLGF